jgi:hypothetical protein
MTLFSAVTRPTLEKVKKHMIFEFRHNSSASDKEHDEGVGKVGVQNPGKGDYVFDLSVNQELSTLCSKQQVSLKMENENSAFSLAAASEELSKMGYIGQIRCV